MRTDPAHDAQQHICVPLHIKQRPHWVALVRCVEQEVMRAFLRRLAEIERRARWQVRGGARVRRTTGRTCVAGGTGHRLLRSAWDRLSQGVGPTRRWAPGLCRGLFVFPEPRKCRTQVVEILGLFVLCNDLNFSQSIVMNLNFFRSNERATRSMWYAVGPILDTSVSLSVFDKV